MSDEASHAGNWGQHGPDGPPPLEPGPATRTSERRARRDDAPGPAAPLAAGELRLAMVRPDLLAEQVLGSVDRIGQNLAAGASLWLVFGVLAVASVAATVPFAALSPIGSFWKVAALFTGSLLVCFPCLHVFLQFLGIRIALVRNLSLSLVITATAGLFTLGFAPIIWFIGLTTSRNDGSLVTAAGLARFLLSVSFVMGLVQMARCLASSRCGVSSRGGLIALTMLWVPLLVFIVIRMADVLGLGG